MHQEISNQQIQCMTKALESLERVDLNERCIEYTKIINEIKCFLYEKCSHHFIKDIIDINPDKCKEIEYCEYCYTNYDAYLGGSIQ